MASGRPPKFLTSQHPKRGLLWASIDTAAHHIDPCVAETRFGGYLKPFPSEDAARQALQAAGATNIQVEPDRKRRRG
jgi:hypothetical protein